MSTPIENLSTTVRMVTEFLECGDYDNARMALGYISIIVARIHDDIAAITAPELTPEERAAQEHERALKQAREEGRKVGLEHARNFGSQPQLIHFNPYVSADLHEAWREGYVEGLEIPF